MMASSAGSQCTNVKSRHPMDAREGCTTNSQSSEMFRLALEFKAVQLTETLLAKQRLTDTHGVKLAQV